MRELTDHLNKYTVHLKRALRARPRLDSDDVEARLDRQNVARLVAKDARIVPPERHVGFKMVTPDCIVFMASMRSPDSLSAVLYLRRAVAASGAQELDTILAAAAAQQTAAQPGDGLAGSLNRLKALQAHDFLTSLQSRILQVSLFRQLCLLRPPHLGRVPSELYSGLSKASGVSVKMIQSHATTGQKIYLGCGGHVGLVLLLPYDERITGIKVVLGPLLRSIPVKDVEVLAEFARDGWAAKMCSFCTAVILSAAGNNSPLPEPVEEMLREIQPPRAIEDREHLLRLLDPLEPCNCPAPSLSWQEDAGA